MRWIILVAAMMAVTGCGSEDADTTAKQQPGATSSEIAQARAEAEKMIAKVELPSYAPPAPVNGACADTLCETTKVAFVRRDWPGAWRGDYDAQQNVAYCLSNGCDGAVQLDTSAGCAWRDVIIKSNSDSATSLDADKQDAACSKLTDTQRSLALQKVDSIVSVIQGASRP